MSDLPTAELEHRYSRLAKLGEGTYGIVYRAVDLETGREVALKRMRTEAWSEGVPATALREISVLKEIDHPCIVRLLNVFVSASGNLYLVFELLDRDLKAEMDLHKGLGMDLRKAKSIFYSMLSGLAACHSHRIVHRDMKPQNVLISGGVVKIADFGLARAYSIPVRQYTHEVVTLWYRAPEILLGAKFYSTPVDVWSTACIFLEMVNGIPLFPGDSEIDELYKIFRILGTPTDETWPGYTSLPEFSERFPKWPSMPWSRIVPALAADPAGLDLLASMLHYNPTYRISAQSALEHPFFDDLRMCMTSSGASTAPPGSSPGVVRLPAPAAAGAPSE